jgi:hypothetical protein
MYLLDRRERLDKLCISELLPRGKNDDSIVHDLRKPLSQHSTRYSSLYRILYVVFGREINMIMIDVCIANFFVKALGGIIKLPCPYLNYI